MRKAWETLVLDRSAYSSPCRSRRSRLTKAVRLNSISISSEPVRKGLSIQMGKDKPGFGPEGQTKRNELAFLRVHGIHRRSTFQMGRGPVSSASISARRRRDFGRGGLSGRIPCAGRGSHPGHWPRSRPRRGSAAAECGSGASLPGEPRKGSAGHRLSCPDGSRPVAACHPDFEKFKKKFFKKKKKKKKKKKNINARREGRAQTQTPRIGCGR